MRVIEGTLVAPKGKFAIVVSRFNAFITEKLLEGAVDALVRHGAKDADLEVFRVPGTWEIPGVVRKVAATGNYVGVITLGCVIRGGTPHFEYVSAEVAKGVGAASAAAECPVTFGVLTCDSVEQAIDRAGVKAGNKGAEAAVACIEMANLYAKLES